jgi:hypothetical protein
VIGTLFDVSSGAPILLGADVFYYVDAPLEPAGFTRIGGAPVITLQRPYVELQADGIHVSGFAERPNSPNGPLFTWRRLLFVPRGYTPPTPQEEEIADDSYPGAN